jgi:hypothetical protein
MFWNSKIKNGRLNQIFEVNFKGPITVLQKCEVSYIKIAIPKSDFFVLLVFREHTMSISRLVSADL